MIYNTSITDYDEYSVTECDLSDFIAGSVKVFPVYVYSDELKNIVATNDPTAENKLLANLCVNRHEVLVAVQSLVDRLEY